MPWPRADFVLYVFGAFVFAYGISICVRARRARVWAAGRKCPTCRRSFGGDGVPEACTHCGDRPPRGVAGRRPSRWVAVGGLTSLAGFLLFALGVAIVSWLDQLQYEFDGGSVDAAPDVVLGPYVGAGMGFSAFALFLGFRAYRGDRPRGRRRCPRCWYLVDEGVGRKCSECGHEARRERDLYRPRRRWRLVMAALVLAAIGQAGWLEARVRRGGWLAAVPTEVLILGMPWVPEWWLHGGHDNAEEDWSLAGRALWENGIWRWHVPWMRARATDWLRSTREPEVLTSRLDALGIGAQFKGAAFVLEDGPIAVHLLEVGLIASERGDSSAARHLFEGAWQFGFEESHSPIAEPEPEFGSHVIAQTNRLLAAYARDPSTDAGIVLAMGDGRPEVVRLLLDHVVAGYGDSTYALASLAARHAHVQRQLADVIADPDDARRGVITGLVCRMSRDRHTPELVAAVRELVQSENPDEAIEGIRAVLTAMPEESELATRRGLEIIEMHPSRASDAAEVLMRSRILLEFSPELRRLTRSEDRRVRQAADALEMTVEARIIQSTP